MRLAAAIAFAVVFAPALFSTLLDHFRAQAVKRRRREQMRAWQRGAFEPWRRW